MELICDNAAAIVLATGEGSWRTKSAANKLHAVKEKADRGNLEVTYVSTRDQCADSLTKFLKGGQDQLRANEHLSLVNLEEWLPRRGLVTKARGVRFSDRPEIFHFVPGVFRVFVSEPDLSDREFSTVFGPASLDWRKNVCVGCLNKMHVSVL